MSCGKNDRVMDIGFRPIRRVFLEVTLEVTVGRLDEAFLPPETSSVFQAARNGGWQPGKSMKNGIQELFCPTSAI
jgi:hypothetical protein